MTRRVPDDPVAFRQSVLARLRTVARDRRQPIQDLQLRLILERFLARLFVVPQSPWVLKGGFAMDLRYRPRARTTRDVDLTIRAVPEIAPEDRSEWIREQLQGFADVDSGDHLVYRIGTARKVLPAPPFGGASFPAEALIAGKVLGRFRIDVGFGDPSGGPPDRLAGDDLLAFAGIAPAEALAVLVAQQFAEKIHAYTFPWSDRENTRVKDLVDLTILVERDAPRADDVALAIDTTFARRGTHRFPETLAAPPRSWLDEYSALATRIGLESRSADEAFEKVAAFLRGVDVPIR